MQPTITGNIINYDNKYTHTCHTVTHTYAVECDRFNIIIKINIQCDQCGASLLNSPP